jgi:lysozyme
MRQVNKAGIDLIKRWEAFFDHVYICPAGYKTIGWGHLVKEGEIFGVITQDEGEVLLRKDLGVAIQGILRYISVPLTDNQFGALVSFCFNLGNGCIQRSTLRQRLNRQDYDVTNEFLKYNKAGGRVLKGLTRRRIAEASLFNL